MVPVTEGDAMIDFGNVPTAPNLSRHEEIQLRAMRDTVTDAFAEYQLRLKQLWEFERELTEKHARLTQ